MLRKLLSALGIGAADTPGTSVSGPSFTPYRKEAANQAYNRLFGDLPEGLKAAHGDAPAPLLGAIIEMAAEKGLDVLAVRSDGTFLYITKTGQLLDLEGTSSLQIAATNLLKSSEELAASLRPGDGPRLLPPVKGNARLTFFLPEGRSSSLEGSMASMVKDPLAGPIVRQSIDLLLAALSASAKKITGGAGG